MTEAIDVAVLAWEGTRLVHARDRVRVIEQRQGRRVGVQRAIVIHVIDAVPVIIEIEVVAHGVARVSGLWCVRLTVAVRVRAGVRVELLRRIERVLIGVVTDAIEVRIDGLRGAQRERV